MILPYPMTYVWMTARARQLLATRLRAMLDRVRDRFVTIAACFFGYLMIARRDAQRIREAARGKVERVPEPVTRFHHVFANQIVGSMAIIAYRNRAVGRFTPRIQMIAHDVTVAARVRIVRQIRCAARVNESECTDPDRHPKQDHGDQNQPVGGFSLQSRPRRADGGRSCK
jgi:hypothetical protein